MGLDLGEADEAHACLMLGISWNWQRLEEMPRLTDVIPSTFQRVSRVQGLYPITSLAKGVFWSCAWTLQVA